MPGAAAGVGSAATTGRQANTRTARTRRAFMGLLQTRRGVSAPSNLTDDSESLAQQPCNSVPLGITSPYGIAPTALLRCRRGAGAFHACGRAVFRVAAVVEPADFEA